MAIMQNRRRFVTNAAVAGVAGFGALGAVGRGGGGKSLAAEPAAGNIDIRLSKFPGICIAPQYIVGDLLRAEGFTEIRYVPLLACYQHEQLARGEADFSLHFAAPTIMAIDAGKPITVIAGIHVGCFELYRSRRNPKRCRSETPHRGCSGPGLKLTRLRCKHGQLCRTGPW